MANEEIDELIQYVPAKSFLEGELLDATSLGLDVTSWTDESPPLIIFSGNARALERLSIAGIEFYRAGFLSTGRGAGLTLTAREFFETERLDATFATCLGSLNNVSPNTYTIPAGDTLVVKKTGMEVTYAIDGPLTISPGSTNNLVTRCEVAGSIGSADVGEIAEIIGASLPDVSYINTSVAVGRDVEADADLKERARLAVGPLSPAGPKNAYAYIASGGKIPGAPEYDAQAEAIALIGVTPSRTQVVGDPNTGAITAYYGTPSGGISNPDVALINAAILERVSGPGDDYTGLTAVALTINVDYVAYARASLNLPADAIMAVIDQQIVDYIPLVPIGGYPEITPTPGITGSITVSDTRALITRVIIGGADVVHNATHSLNTLGEIQFAEGQFPVLGVITGSVIFQ